MLRGLKNKNTILIVGLCLALFLCYKLAISKTLSLRKELIAREKEEQRFSNVPQQLSSLSKKEVHLDSLLQALNLNNTSLENDLLRTLNMEADKNHLTIIDFNPPHISQTNGTIYNTYNFTVRGSFSALVKLLYSLEQQASFGQITHLDLKKEKNYRTRKNYLDATVFIQKME